MSTRENDDYLEGINERWQEAMQEGDTETMFALEDNLRENGFDKEADALVELRNIEDNNP